MAMTHKISCVCGATRFQLTGSHILATECMCNSCRAAAACFSTLSGAISLLDEKGATFTVSQRKDRVACLAGTEFLREHRLKPDSKTRRVVAICCNSPIFKEFSGAHWIDIYNQRWSQHDAPPVEMRTMVSDLPPGTRLPDDVPNHKKQSIGFFVKIFGAWIAMGFRNPQIDYVKGKLDVC